MSCGSGTVGARFENCRDLGGGAKGTQGPFVPSDTTSGAVPEGIACRNASHPRDAGRLQLRTLVTLRRRGKLAGSAKTDVMKSHLRLTWANNISEQCPARRALATRPSWGWGTAGLQQIHAYSTGKHFRCQPTHRWLPNSESLARPVSRPGPDEPEGWVEDPPGPGAGNGAAGRRRKLTGRLPTVTVSSHCGLPRPPSLPGNREREVEGHRVRPATQLRSANRLHRGISERVESLPTTTVPSRVQAYQQTTGVGEWHVRLRDR
jgi:hypothetical protein